MNADAWWQRFQRGTDRRCGRRPDSGRLHSISAILALWIAPLLSSCANVDVLMLSSETFTAQSNHVEILDRAPTRPYVQIAVLTVNSWWVSAESRREKIVEKATALGADAVVFGDLRLPPATARDRPVEKSAPPPSSPTTESETAPEHDRHSSFYRRAGEEEVRIYLVRGGGHGGGRGGGHGHGGHWGGRSGHPGFRSWRHVPGPGFRGYGFYAPGWYGYGPYWSPYWGYYPYGYPYGYYYDRYPYSSYGDMNTLTVATAIHYTD